MACVGPDALVRSGRAKLAGLDASRKAVLPGLPGATVAPALFLVTAN
jgi:hypothetical protein